MALTCIIEPAVPPLHALALQDHVRQDITTDNVQLDAWVRSARRFAEAKCNRTLIAARYKMTLDGWPYGSTLILERGPVLAVQSVKYVDLAGVQQTFASTDWVADLSGQIGRITPRFGKVWPANVIPQIGAVEVTYDAGDAAGITVNTTTDVFTIVGGIWKTLTVGDAVRFTNSGGALPAPLAVDTDYYIQSTPTATTFTLSATQGGALLDITTTGTGQSYIGYVPEDVSAWMKLRVGALYENREDTMVVQRGTLLEIPYMDRLLDGSTVRIY